MNKKEKILIVDDLLINRSILKKILSEDYTIVEASNGKEAFEVLENTSEINLIILDIEMPVMNGLEFLELKRKNTKYDIVPVIVATQKNTTQDEIDALTLGATDFIIKPYNAMVIKKRVNNLIELEKSLKVINTIKIDNNSGLYTKEYFNEVAREIISNSLEDYDLIISEIKVYTALVSNFSKAFLDVLLKTISKTFTSLINNEGIISYFGDGVFYALVKSGSVDYKKFDKINEEMDSRLNEWNVVLQFGIYRKIDHSLSFEQIIGRTNFALKDIENSAINHVKFFDEDDNTRYLKKLEIESTMAQAIKNKDFKLFLQPKFNILNDTIIGAEALSRWKLNDETLRYPNDFIPLFENNGFITLLDKYMWEETIKLIKEFEQLGINIPISVNISRFDFIRINVAKTIISMTQDYKINVDHLHLEITESAYSTDDDIIKNNIEELRNYGFKIEMDDFGTGYSNLSNLGLLPIDILKLDMRFVKGDFEKKKDVFNWVIKLASLLHLDVICEGLETIEMKENLIESGCKYAQGYLYSKPISIEEFKEMYWTVKK